MIRHRPGQVSVLSVDSMEPSNILVRGVNWLGDAVMTTPALARLRAALPDSRLSLLTPSALADLWRHHPDVDQVIPFDPGESPLDVGRRLRSGGYDCALLFPNSPRSALEVFLAGIPRRIGLRRPWRNLLLTEPVAPRVGETPMRKRSTAAIRRLLAQPSPAPRPPYSGRAHHVHHYLHLAGRLGAETTPLAPRIVVADDEIASFRKSWLQSHAGVTHWLGLNPGAAYGPAKRWPEDRFVEAATILHRDTGCGCLLTGGPADRPLADAMAQHLARNGVSPLLNLAGRTSLRELCAALRMAHALLTNDSGPMHLAAALGTPVVALFGSTAPELTAPGHPDDPGPHQLLRQPPPCAPCFRRDCPVDRRCLTHIPVERAVAALRQVWCRSPGTQPR